MYLELDEYLNAELEEAGNTSSNAPASKSIADCFEVVAGALLVGDRVLSTVSDWREDAVVVDWLGSDEAGSPSVAGSGTGPSIAHRLLSYFERMNCSILLRKVKGEYVRFRCDGSE